MGGAGCVGLLETTLRFLPIVVVANLASIPAPLLAPLFVGRLGRSGTVIAGALGVAAALALLALSGSWLVAALVYASMSLLAAMVRSAWTLRKFLAEICPKT